LQETEGDDITIKLDAWQNDGQYGTFFQLKVNTWKKTETLEAPKPPVVDDSDVPF
jgi:hypothetical protein